MTMQHPTTLKDLETLGVRYVRLTWVDFINFVRYRVIPIEHFKKLIAGSSAIAKNGSNSKINPNGGIMLAKVTFGLVYIALAPGFSAAGEYLYVPDLRSSRILSFAPGHASVMGWFEEKEAVKSANGQDTFEVPYCPRALVQRIVQEAKEADGIDFLMGFETEVIFLKSTDPLRAANDYGWSESPAICAGTPEAKALEEIAEALRETGIELNMYHAEAAPGQFEIVTGPLPPLEACDALVATREIIMNICSKHGMRATLAPRVYKNNCGSAAHTHISLKSPKYPAARYPAPGEPSVLFNALETSFISGLLSHLPAITAFTLPIPASYDRMVDGVWSGGTWVSWGRDNRESPIRLCGRGAPDYNFEVKSIDGTACPYLAAAALLAGGLDGVRRNTPLAMQGLSGLASALSETERKEKGVTTRMPLDIEEARKALREDTVLAKALGEDLVKTYLTVNETLEKQLEQPTTEATMLKLIATY